MENWSRYSAAIRLALYNVSSPPPPSSPFFFSWERRNKKGETSRSCGRNSAVWLAIFAASRGDRKDNRDGSSRTFISTFTTPGRAPLTFRISYSVFFTRLPKKKKKKKENISIPSNAQSYLDPTLRGEILLFSREKVSSKGGSEAFRKKREREREREKKKEQGTFSLFHVL